MSYSPSQMASGLGGGFGERMHHTANCGGGEVVALGSLVSLVQHVHERHVLDTDGGEERHVVTDIRAVGEGLIPAVLDHDDVGGLGR
jgi:hypothetical protein